MGKPSKNTSIAKEATVANLLKLGNRTHGFTMVPNSFNFNTNITAMGLLCFFKIKSLPPEWNFSAKGLVEVIPQYGKDAINSGLNNLEENGYLIRCRYRKKDNLLGNAYWILLDEPEYYDAYLELFELCGLMVTPKYINKVEQMTLSETNKKGVISDILMLTVDDFSQMIEEELAK